MRAFDDSSASRWHPKSGAAVFREVPCIQAPLPLFSTAGDRSTFVSKDGGPGMCLFQVEARAYGTMAATMLATEQTHPVQLFAQLPGSGRP